MIKLCLWCNQRTPHDPDDRCTKCGYQFIKSAFTSESYPATVLHDDSAGYPPACSKCHKDIPPEEGFAEDVDDVILCCDCWSSETGDERMPPTKFMKAAVAQKVGV